MPFPETRLRRLRQTATFRRLVRETALSVDDLVLPLFVRDGIDRPNPIASLEGHAQWPAAAVAEEAKRAADLGVPAVLLFGLPDHKDAHASSAYAPDGVVCRAIEGIKRACPELLVMTDVCLCAYTDHGHCGVVGRGRGGAAVIDNDRSLELIARQAVAHARAGADLVAPSDMMDGRVGAIRSGLDVAGLTEVAIMAYSAKFASAFYGPFRDAADSAPQFGDRTTYQMDPANGHEAMREIELDIDEGADIVMVKPALAYLDLIRLAADTFAVPLAAYNVSGEYAMVKAAAARGWLDEKRAAMEIMTAIRRAGAKIVITYWAKDAAGWLR
jgi:porphobilinogen synthase